jgi:BRCT domain type II-containing protein
MNWLTTSDNATNATAEGEANAKPKTKTPKTDKEANGEGATKTNSKKKTVPDGQPHSLAGQMVATSGTLRTMDRATFEQTVEKFGGSNVTKFSDATKIVLGDKPGPERTEEITTGGYRTIDEEEFYEMIGADFAPPAKKAKKEWEDAWCGGLSIHGGFAL